MDRQRRVPVAKRPLGVNIIMEGGLKGYSGCMKPLWLLSIMHKLLFEWQYVDHTHREAQLADIPAPSIRSVRWPFQQEVPFCIVKPNVTMSIVCDTAVRTKTTTLTQHVSLVDEYCWNMRRRIAQERLEHTLREFVICFMSLRSLPTATVYLHLFFQLGHAHLRRHVMAQTSGFRQQAGMLGFCEACRA